MLCIYGYSPHGTCPVVNRDVMDAENYGQVYPPGGVLLSVTRNDTMSSPETQV